MNQNEKLKLIAKAADSKRADDIKIIKIADLTIISDYFVIANGSSSTQTKAIADEIEFKMKEAGVFLLRTEGYQGANWIILDYGDIVVHVFYKETRDFYNLERLWNDGEEIDVEALL